MLRSTVAVLALLALAGCAPRGTRAGDLAPSAVAAKRAIVRIDVTNTFGRTIDVYYSSTYLGSLGPYGHGSYTVPPTTYRVPVYASWSGNPQRTFNISRANGVRYIHGDAAPEID